LTDRRWRAPKGVSPLCSKTRLKGKAMLYTIAVVLLILWLLGLVTSYTIGGFIHVLLVVALIMTLVNFISGRRAV
jgi:hypothetical protein